MGSHSRARLGIMKSSSGAGVRFMISYNVTGGGAMALACSIAGEAAKLTEESCAYSSQLEEESWAYASQLEEES
jgi:hypothetical protein